MSEAREHAEAIYKTRDTSSVIEYNDAVLLVKRVNPDWSYVMTDNIAWSLWQMTKRK